MKSSLKSIFFILVFSFAAFTSVYAIDINQLKFENGTLTIEGNKVQSVNCYVQGGGLFTKAADITAFSLAADSLTIATKDRSITVVLSAIKVVVFGIRDAILGIYIS